MVVGITHDTAGPYIWAQALAAQLKSARLLTFDGYGHGAVTVSTCDRAIEGDYLLIATAETTLGKR